MTLQPTRLLLTTFTSLLDVHVCLETKQLTTNIIDQGKGIYFGLTSAQGQFLVAARNLNAEGKVVTAGIQTNVIYSLDPKLSRLEPIIEDPQLLDLHQIRAWGRNLFVVLGQGSVLGVFDIPTGRREQWLHIGQYVPQALQSDDNRHGADRFHFNSITFSRTSAVVLAHNWERPSFALEFSLPTWSLRPRLSTPKVHTNVGTKAHDVFQSSGSLFVLDSGGAQIRVNESPALSRTVPLPQRGYRTFPRGMAVTRDHIWVASSMFCERDPAARATAPSHITVFDRKNLNVVLDAELGTFGNTCDLLAISEPDLTDGEPSRFRQVPRQVSRVAR